MKTIDPDVAPASRHIIRRPRLLRQLDETSARIILLVAPAGYGKTTLARQWLERGDKQVAWYAGSPASADVAALAAGLAHAVEPLLPGASVRVTERVRASRNPQLEARLLAEIFTEDLQHWPERAWLCVDDYQFVTEAEAAEDFVEIIATTAPVRVLVVGRERPRWATARLRLYGDSREVARDELAFTRDEARRVLSSPRESTSALLDTARGWPAVVGLAALTRRVEVPRDEIPDELYDYFAQELYRRAPDWLQRRLLELALVPSIDDRLASILFGAEASTIVEAASELGFITADRGTLRTVHPLLRAFLHRLLVQQPSSDVAELVTEVGSVLVNEKRWDDAFALVEQFGDIDLLAHLFAASVQALLDEGRVATLRRWLDFARARSSDRPVFDLADAEIALRSGNHARSVVLAERAARRLGQSNHLTAEAWLVAARAAHMASHEEQALSHLEQARRHAATSRDLHEALWLEFIVHVELERKDLQPMVERLEQLADGGPELEMRTAFARAGVLDRTRCLGPAIDELLAAEPLLERVRNPMIRSSYFNRLSYDLVLNGRYSDALRFAKRCLSEITDSRLTFVVGHLEPTFAGAHLGLRNFRRAYRHGTHAMALAHEMEDTYVELNGRIVIARTLLAQSRFSDAVSALAEDPRSAVPRGLLGEYLALRALAFASTGETSRARATAEAARTTTSTLESKVIGAWARAVCALQERKDRADEEIAEAFAITEQTGAVDGFVAAYRAHPPLLRAVAAVTEDTAAIRRITTRANDHTLAASAGITARDPAAPVPVLTEREQEVLRLVREGLTNREIAAKLFISEATAKVHIRHILNKLGVRSRTEAAVQGVELLDR